MLAPPWLRSKHQDPNSRFAPGTLLRSPFHQLFGHEHQAKNLRPFRDDVSYHLSPLGLRLRVGKEYDPGHTGNQQKDGERMLAQEFLQTAGKEPSRLFAFRRAAL